MREVSCGVFIFSGGLGTAQWGGKKGGMDGCDLWL